MELDLDRTPSVNGTTFGQLFNVRPAQPSFNAIDRANSDVVFLCQFRVFITTGKFLANLDHIRIRKFCLRIYRALAISIADLKCIGNVFLNGNGLQVEQPIICFYGVDMVSGESVKTFRVKECAYNQSMNGADLRNTVHGKIDIQIPSGHFRWLKNPAAAMERANSAKIRDFVASLVPNNWQPIFHSGIMQ